MSIAWETEDRGELIGRLLYLAWRWYQISSDVAEDIAQAAMVTYLQVRERYPPEDRHPRMLVGIFRNKCREYIDSSVRAQNGLRRLKKAAAAGVTQIPAIPADGSPEDGVLADLLTNEKGRLILDALAALRPPAREMFRLIIEEGASRQDLIAHYGINKNTLDSRLHVYRNELREVLEERGIDV